MRDDSERRRQLTEIAGAELSADSAWIVVAAVPGEPDGGRADLTGERLQPWAREQVAVWPAPIPIGRDRPRLRAGTATFASPERYHCTFGADGSAVLALPVGSLRDSPADDVRVWAIGEGAVAWITAAGLRLAAAFADRAGIRGKALAEVVVTSSRPGDAVPFEVWNRNAHGFGAVGHRLAVVRPVQRSIDLVGCLASGLPGVARPLVLDLLRQFGLSESRHIDSDGVLRRRNFTGYEDRIRAWSSAIGAPSA